MQHVCVVKVDLDGVRFYLLGEELAGLGLHFARGGRVGGKIWGIY